MFMAYFILGEEIGRRDIFATVASGAFAVGVLLSGPAEVKDDIATVY